MSVFKTLTSVLLMFSALMMGSYYYFAFGERHAPAAASAARARAKMPWPRLPPSPPPPPLWLVGSWRQALPSAQWPVPR